jgi:hypothetical protein
MWIVDCLDADPDPTFYYDPDPDSDTGPTPRFTRVGKSEISFAFIHSIASSHCFTFLVSVISVISFNILGQFVEIFCKKLVKLHIWLKWTRILNWQKALKFVSFCLFHRDLDPGGPHQCRSRFALISINSVL